MSYYVSVAIVTNKEDLMSVKDILEKNNMFNKCEYYITDNVAVYICNYTKYNNVKNILNDLNSNSISYNITEHGELDENGIEVNNYELPYILTDTIFDLSEYEKYKSHIPIRFVKI